MVVVDIVVVVNFVGNFVADFTDEVINVELGSAVVVVDVDGGDEIS